VVWATYTRMWGASKALTSLMRKPVIESDILLDTVELLMPGTQLIVWSRKDGTPYPSLAAAPDPDDLYPEEYVTKPFWKNLYQGMERRRNVSKPMFNKI
jgi:hypothetical protein